MHKTVVISDVAECTIPECVYNRGSRCYAQAITIGNGGVPECATFYASNEHRPKRDTTAGVGACTVYACRHNRDYSCTADRIYVGYVQTDICCITYSEQ